MKERIARFEERPKSALADERQHAALQADHRADERVQADEQAELARRSRAARAAPSPLMRGRAAVPLRFAATISACPAGAGGISTSSASRERVRVAVRSSGLWRRSKPIDEKGLPESAAPADRAAEVARVDDTWSGSSSSRASEPCSVRAWRLRVAVRVQVGATDVADQQRVAGEDEPRLLGAAPRRRRVGVVLGRVARRGDRASRSCSRARPGRRPRASTCGNSTAAPAGR